MPNVSAVIVTWQSGEDIAGCLGSVYADGGIAEVIVVDNASADCTVRDIEEKFPSVRLVRNQANMGFAAAANDGIKLATGEYVLVMNPDVRLEPGCAGALARALDGDRGAAAAAPMLTRPDGTLDSAGLMMRRDRKAVDIGAGEDPAKHRDGRRVFGACGAAAMYRMSALEDAKCMGEYFDESFFAYKEDVDLSWRFDLLGGKTVYVPGAAARHGRGWKAGARSAMPRFVRRHSHKNRYLTIIKNDDSVNVLLHLPWILAYEAALFGYALIFEPFLLKAYADVIRLMPELLKKRREIMRRRRVSAGEMRGLIG